jgi:hypothetical protein
MAVRRSAVTLGGAPRPSPEVRQLDCCAKLAVKGLDFDEISRNEEDRAANPLQQSARKPQSDRTTGDRK